MYKKLKTFYIIFSMMKGRIRIEEARNISALISSISRCSNIRKIRKINNSSLIQKYYICTRNEELLLHLCEAKRSADLNSQRETLNILIDNGISTQMPLEIGVYNNEWAYLLTTWIEGITVERAIFQLNESEQYHCGKKAGSLLKQIHGIKVDIKTDSLYSRFDNIAVKYLQHYDKGLTSFKESFFFNYLKDISIDPSDELSVMLHGDYHMKNIIIDKYGELHVIDMASCLYGNPLEDLVRNVINAKSSKHFARGLVDCYFDLVIEDKVWVELKVLTFLHQLEILDWNKWDKKFNDSFKKQQHDIVYENYKDYKSIKPKYYSE